MNGGAAARLLSTLALTACAGCAGKQWHVLPTPPDSLGQLAGEVRLTLNDGMRLMVTSPRVRNDSVFGRTDTGAVALPLSHVSRVAVEGPSPDKATATRVLLVAAGITFAGLLVLVLATMQ